MTTRVVGIGNPLRGDDGIGVAVIGLLEMMPLPDDVEVVDAGQAGLALVGLMEDVDKVVLVDAVDMGGMPGDVTAFHLEDVLIEEEETDCSIHHARTGTAIRLANALGCLPLDVTVIGIQPGQMNWGAGLSSEVKRAVHQAASMIQKLVSDQKE